MPKINKIFALGLVAILISFNLFAGAFIDLGQETEVDIDFSELDLSGRIEKIKSVLTDKEEELSAKKREYIEAKNSLKEAARTGFLGFGRSKEEIQSLVKEKEKTAQVRQEYIKIRRQISRLQTKLKEAKREKALIERRRQ